MATPKVEPKKPIKPAQLIARMAALALAKIKKRAFPDDASAAGNVRGGTVPPLSARYAAYKSGNVQYGSEAAQKAAKTRRAKTKPGQGPLVTGPGGQSRRLAPRSSKPDQRLSDQTAKDLRVLRRNKKKAVIGFSTARSRNVAAQLQRRNRFFALTREEKRRVLDISKKAAKGVGIRVKGGRIKIPFRL